MKSGITITKDGLKKLVQSLNALPMKDVLVGIPEDADERFSDNAIKEERKSLKSAGKKNTVAEAVKSLSGSGAQGINNASLGYIHEHGAPEANIPARPFLVQGIINAQPKITSLFKQAGKAALDGDKEKLDRVLHAAGLTAQASVRDAMSTSEYPPLADATLAARRRRGRTGTRPLIDTGQLRNSINYVIRDTGKGKK